MCLKLRTDRPTDRTDLFGRVVVWKVRTGDVALGGRDLVLAAALLAVVLVVVQHKA